jgi:uncharacterized membrane protein
MSPLFRSESFVVGAMISRAAGRFGLRICYGDACPSSRRLARSRVSLRMNLALRHAFLGAFFLHTLSVLWAWRSWGEFGRGNLLTWMDFPVSLAFLQLTGRRLLLGSFLLGGLEWGSIGLLLTFFLGRAARRGRPASPPSAPPSGPLAP